MYERAVVDYKRVTYDLISMNFKSFTKNGLQIAAYFFIWSINLLSETAPRFPPNITSTSRSSVGGCGKEAIVELRVCEIGTRRSR